MNKEQTVKNDTERQLDHAIRQVARKKARKRLCFWIIVIFMISILLSLFVSFIPVMYEKFIHYNDPAYRPMDIEREYQKLLDRREGAVSNK
jgi:ABC-type microcin C transport system permease subunit YejE